MFLSQLPVIAFRPIGWGFLLGKVMAREDTYQHLKPFRTMFLKPELDQFTSSHFPGVDKGGMHGSEMARLFTDGLPNPDSTYPRAGTSKEIEKAEGNVPAGPSGRSETSPVLFGVVIAPARQLSSRPRGRGCGSGGTMSGPSKRPKPRPRIFSQRGRANAPTQPGRRGWPPGPSKKVHVVYCPRQKRGRISQHRRTHTWDAMRPSDYASPNMLPGVGLRPDRRHPFPPHNYPAPVWSKTQDRQKLSEGLARAKLHCSELRPGPPNGDDLEHGLALAPVCCPAWEYLREIPRELHRKRAGEPVTTGGLATAAGVCLPTAPSVADG